MMSEQTAECKRWAADSGPCPGCYCPECEDKRRTPPGEPVDTSINIKTGHTKAVIAADKPPMNLLAFDTLEAVSRVMASGIKDHGKRGWEGGVVWMDYLAAAMRHITSWVLKRGPDSKSGESHLDHAIACLMILSASEKRKLGKDDR